MAVFATIPLYRGITNIEYLASLYMSMRIVVRLIQSVFSWHWHRMTHSKTKSLLSHKLGALYAVDAQNLKSIQKT